ncbi:MAG: hypothetical protein IKZ86_11640 [Spirochaetaceae bacterium]|nr:hypothetical protein [Spirochaetaceae bacterium]
MKKVSFNICLIILMLSLSLMLAGCGGGGGGSGNISVFGSSGLGYTDLFNDHEWEYTNGIYKTTLYCNNSKLTAKYLVNGVVQSTSTASYELKDTKEMGRIGKIKCSCINGGAETEYTFDKLVTPKTVTMTFNGASIAFTKK